MNKYKKFQFELNKWATIAHFTLIKEDGVIGKETQKAAQKTFWQIELLMGKVIPETDFTKSIPDILNNIDKLLAVLISQKPPVTKLNFQKPASQFIPIAIIFTLAFEIFKKHI